MNWNERSFYFAEIAAERTPVRETFSRVDGLEAAAFRPKRGLTRPPVH
jgi:hypothetical protein